MATRTLAAAQAELAKAYAARARILDNGQNVAVDGMSSSQANLAALNDTIRLLENECERLTADEAGTPAPFRFALANFNYE
jgi:hypothetical protein